MLPLNTALLTKKWEINICIKAGRNKEKYDNPDWVFERGRCNLFCNKTQSRMFVKMTKIGVIV